MSICMIIKRLKFEYQPSLTLNLQRERISFMNYAAKSCMFFAKLLAITKSIIEFSLIVSFAVLQNVVKINFYLLKIRSYRKFELLHKYFFDR